MILTSLVDTEPDMSVFIQVKGPSNVPFLTARNALAGEITWLSTIKLTLDIKALKFCQSC